MPLLLLAAVVVPAASGQQDRPVLRSWWDRAYESTSRWYHLKTDVPRAEARTLARHLDLMYDEYARRLASLPPRTPEQLNVLVFTDRRDYELTLRARYGVDPAGTGGMFFVNRNGSALAFWTGDLPRRRIEHVIQHEAFHQFAYSRFGGDLPPWVNEGLAEFFGESAVVGERLVSGLASPRVVERIRNALERGEHIPFRRVLAMTDDEWTNALRDETASLQYAQAWSMVHFLVHGDDGRYVEAFERYLRHLNAALPSEEAFVRAFGSSDFEQFEARWREYVATLRPSPFMAALERIEFLAEGMLELNRRGMSQGISTLDLLRERLREFRFVMRHTQHGAGGAMRADEAANYVIPDDDPTDEVQPGFLLTEPNRRRWTIREQKLDERNPMPYVIATEHLRPRNLRVVWKRDRESNTFSYEITAD